MNLSHLVFAVLPDGAVHHGGGILDVGSGGSLLTVAFQILVDSAPSAKLSLGSVASIPLNSSGFYIILYECSLLWHIECSRLDLHGLIELIFSYVG